jgi:hypothetical protein
MFFDEIDQSKLAGSCKAGSFSRGLPSPLAHPETNEIRNRRNLLGRHTGSDAGPLLASSTKSIATSGGARLISKNGVTQAGDRSGAKQPRVQRHFAGLHLLRNIGAGDERDRLASVPSMPCTRAN